jgi:hypothetical protein
MTAHAIAASKGFARPSAVSCGVLILARPMQIMPTNAHPAKRSVASIADQTSVKNGDGTFRVSTGMMASSDASLTRMIAALADFVSPSPS